MVINARNNTLAQIILTDLAGYAIPASSSVDLVSIFNVYDIAMSDVLLLKIAAGDIVINNGTIDLDSSSGIRYVSLFFDGKITNTSEEPIPVTGDVGITGTPSININGVTLVDGAVPVAGDVGITGTPSININGVTLDSGKLPISGTVLVGNEISAPVPVNITNTSVPITGNVGITGSVTITGMPPVTVENTDANIDFQDSPHMDGFNRLRICSPMTLFDSNFIYDDMPLFWDTILAAGGTTAHLPDYDAIRLSTTTTSGSSVARQTRQYIKYQPSQSCLIYMAGVLGAKKANVVKRIGYFSTTNGVFFEQDGTNLKVVRRSSTTGSTVDDSVTQSSWNVDKFDGLGPSGANLDTEKTQLFIIDLQGMSTGRVRFGFDIGGVVYYAHYMKFSNELAVPYMSSTAQPIRYEITNTAATASATDMLQMRSAVVSEGGVYTTDMFGKIFGISNGTVSKNGSTTVYTPILCIRPKLAFKTLQNRALAVPVSTELFSMDRDGEMRLFLNPTLTGASWLSVHTESIVEYDVASTAMSGGLLVRCNYVTAGKQGAMGLSSELEKLVLSTNHNCTSSDILVVGVRGIGGAITTYASMRWKELP